MAKHVFRVEPNAGQEALSLSLVRMHLKLDEEPDGHPDDDLLDVLIVAAREQVESFTGLSLVNRRHELSIDGFNGDYIDLAVWPVTEVTEVNFIDDGGLKQIWASDQYRLDNASRPARLYPGEGGWPKSKRRENAATVIFKAGFVAEDTSEFPIPKTILQSMLLIIGHLYENRQDVVSGGEKELPMGSMSLMAPHRINMSV